MLRIICGEIMEKMSYMEAVAMIPCGVWRMPIILSVVQVMIFLTVRMESTL
ncbi:hypothetical protein SAMN04244572_02507 [Azotobacter beijerinckii]|uniref:Uncharacterized protein n=1 Tax=Azotobacter beijerinckii TaxID=170623 RepID=A0A1H6VSJ4_9GAMM|nr:hypothetical protein SAMN04244579_02264 [Azotobacter beijerinckii]SEJ03610.1 hypothetical protein SAMN04244572_02507 [Azotobacter beijerinckii]